MEPPLQFTTYHRSSNETMGELRGKDIDGVGIYVLHFDDGTEGVFNRSSQQCAVELSVAVLRRPRPGCASRGFRGACC